uniref:Uncharacterized protein n=1 Tax=Rhizophora mucronata TaxID=61149 RepID=A0A2P2JX56_RHIMU
MFSQFKGLVYSDNLRKSSLLLCLCAPCVHCAMCKDMPKKRRRK